MGARVFRAIGIAVAFAPACAVADIGGDALPVGLPPRSAPLVIDAGTDAEAAGADPSDAAARPARSDASADASITQTFAVGSSDCGGGHCNGGYDGVKDPKHLPTASKQCVDRAFARATDFTIGGEPGGRFCDYGGASYGCDSSCDGCNIMTTVTCVKP
jgi:hypothetical protein